MYELTYIFSYANDTVADPYYACLRRYLLLSEKAKSLTIIYMTSLIRLLY